MPLTHCITGDPPIPALPCWLLASVLPRPLHSLTLTKITNVLPHLSFSNVFPLTLAYHAISLLPFSETSTLTFSPPVVSEIPLTLSTLFYLLCYHQVQVNTSLAQTIAVGSYQVLLFLLLPA